MKKVGIVPNPDKENAADVTRNIVDYLTENECESIFPLSLGESLGIEGRSAEYDELYAESDFVVVLGGDGTLLSVARRAAKFGTPILGINLGTLGFLTDVEKTDYKKSLECVLSGNYNIERRMMLRVEVLNKQVGTESIKALNDVCVTRGVFAKIVNLNVFVNGEFLDSFRADGILVSTPTGSTAYNLSAGGPIMKPDAQMLAITPICPHSLNARSVIISADDEVTIKVGQSTRGDLLLSPDGQPGTTLAKDDIIKIKRSKYSANIIKTNNYSFYEILRKKLVRNEG